MHFFKGECTACNITFGEFSVFCLKLFVLNLLLIFKLTVVHFQLLYSGHFLSGRACLCLQP